MFVVKRRNNGDSYLVSHVTFIFYESDYNEYGVCNGVDVLFTLANDSEKSMGRFFNRMTPDSVITYFHEYYEVTDGETLFKWELKPTPETILKYYFQNRRFRKTTIPREERHTIKLLKYLLEKTEAAEKTKEDFLIVHGYKRKRGLVTEDELKLVELDSDEKNLMDFENVWILLPVSLVQKTLKCQVYENISGEETVIRK